MTDLDAILPLWREFQKSRTEYVLGTVVKVEGSGYRKPGARILIGADGRRAGTISGGCLEGDVARKAFWHTEDGPVVRLYSTAAEEGEVPYGMGCGGVVHLLLERSVTADTLMQRLAASFSAREALAIATLVDGSRVAHRALWPAEGSDFSPATAVDQILADLARRGFEEQRSFSSSLRSQDGTRMEVRVEWSSARPGLFVFGAGDDAIPMVWQAKELGWYVAVADGRSNLATRARFPEADEVRVLTPEFLLALNPRPNDAAVVMSHSLVQDAKTLRALLAMQLAYVGVLGPKRRTKEILLTLARQEHSTEVQAERQSAAWMSRLHAPMGLDLGGNTPAGIALSVMAEIQLTHHGASGASLRLIRGVYGEPITLTASRG